MADKDVTIDPKEKEILLKLRKPFELAAIPKELFHYTTAAGLQGILTDQVFWASAVGFSNDISEGRYATELGSRIFERHPIKKDDDCKDLATLVKGLFLPPRSAWEDGYVVSFCAKDDLLGQWRAYGGAASFSIGLSVTGKNVVSNYGDELRMSGIVYDVDKQASILSDGLTRCQEYLRAKPSTDQEWRQFVFFLTYLVVTQWACSVKHPAFVDEKEWRITIFPKYRKQTMRDLLSGTPLTLEKLPKIRQHRGRLLPYVEVRPKEGSFDVTSVMVGPTSTREVDARAAELLKQSLKGNYKVFVSSIPVRE